MHHPVRETAGKIILEELPALAHHKPVADPADTGGDAGNQITVSQMQIGKDQGRANDSYCHKKPDKRRPAFDQAFHRSG